MLKQKYYITQISKRLYEIMFDPAASIADMSFFNPAPETNIK